MSGNLMAFSYLWLSFAALAALRDKRPVSRKAAKDAK